MNAAPLGNYRKAVDWQVALGAEVPCKDCRWSVLRKRTNRYECRAGIIEGKGLAVGRNNTCDYAQMRGQTT